MFSTNCLKHFVYFRNIEKWKADFKFYHLHVFELRAFFRLKNQRVQTTRTWRARNMTQTSSIKCKGCLYSQDPHTHDLPSVLKNIINNHFPTAHKISDRYGKTATTTTTLKTPVLDNTPLLLACARIDIFVRVMGMITRRQGRGPRRRRATRTWRCKRTNWRNDSLARAFLNFEHFLASILALCWTSGPTCRNVCWSGILLGYGRGPRWVKSRQNAAFL